MSELELDDRRLQGIHLPRRFEILDQPNRIEKQLAFPFVAAGGAEDADVGVIQPVGYLFAIANP